MKFDDDLPAESASEKDSTANAEEKIVTRRQPADSFWYAIETKCPDATLKEKAIMWTLFNLYALDENWPYYEDVAVHATSGYKVRCLYCGYISQYIPPFENNREIHDAIHELVVSGDIRCEIDSVEYYPDGLMQEPGFQPKVILVAKNQELIDAVLSDFRGDTAR